MTPRQHLLRQITKQDNGCWIWTGARCRNGYGSIWASGKTRYTHRLAYEIYVGPVPQGLWVLHTCGERACCNPKHLFASRTRVSLEERLLRKVEKQPGGCWIWQGETNQGYGQINLSGRRRTVHRVAYEVWIEPIPEGLQVQHLCGNRGCCNPDHLATGTAQESARFTMQCRRKGDDHPSRTHIRKGEGQSVATFLERI